SNGDCVKAISDEEMKAGFGPVPFRSVFGRYRSTSAAIMPRSGDSFDPSQACAKRQNENHRQDGSGERDGDNRREMIANVLALSFMPRPEPVLAYMEYLGFVSDKHTLSNLRTIAVPEIPSDNAEDSGAPQVVVGRDFFATMLGTKKDETEQEEINDL